MKKSTQFYLTVLIGALIIASAIIIAQDLLTPTGYTAVIEGIEFSSKGRQLSDLFSDIRDRQSFIVSPEFYEKAAINSYMAKPLALFNGVLIANGKSVISMPRVIDLQQKKILYCQTNDGNVLGNRKVEVDECNGFLNDETFFRISIAVPDNSLPKSKVLVNEDSIEIYPKNYNDVSNASYVVLKTIYSNSPEIIARINAILKKVG